MFDHINQLLHIKCVILRQYQEKNLNLAFVIFPNPIKTKQNKQSVKP